MDAPLDSLTERESSLVRETEPERLADAQRDPQPTVPEPRNRRNAPLNPQRFDHRPQGPGLQKRQASERAAGSRRQARRDSR